MSLAVRAQHHTTDLPVEHAHMQNVYQITGWAKNPDCFLEIR